MHKIFDLREMDVEKLRTLAEELKIKGFKKSFYFYIGLCVVVLAALIAIEVLTENLNVFSSIFALLTGAAG